MKHASLAGLLALAAAGVSGFAFATGGPEERAPRAIRTPEAGPELARLRAELALLATRVEEREVPAPAFLAGTLPDELAANTAAVRALAAELAELRTALRAVASAGAPGATGAPGPLRDEQWNVRQPDWLAWESVLGEWNEDPDLARRSVLLLTPSQLVARFGTPTRIRGEDDGAVKWCYWRELGPGAWDLRVTVTLRGDYVTALDVRRT